MVIIVCSGGGFEAYSGVGGDGGGGGGGDGGGGGGGGREVEWGEGIWVNK